MNCEALEPFAVIGRAPQLYRRLRPGEKFANEIFPLTRVDRSLGGKVLSRVNPCGFDCIVALNYDRLPFRCVPELVVDRMPKSRLSDTYLLDRQTGEQTSPGHELAINKKMLPVHHE